MEVLNWMLGLPSEPSNSNGMGDGPALTACLQCHPEIAVTVKGALHISPTADDGVAIYLSIAYMASYTSGQWLIFTENQNMSSSLNVCTLVRASTSLAPKQSRL